MHGFFSVREKKHERSTFRNAKKRLKKTGGECVLPSKRVALFLRREHHQYLRQFRRRSFDAVFLFFANSPSNRGLCKEYRPPDFSKENLFSRLSQAIWRQRRPKFSVFFLPRPHGLREPAQISQKQPRFQNQRIFTFFIFCLTMKLYDAFWQEAGKR